MKVEPRRPLFNKKQTPNLYRVFLWVVLIVLGYWLISQLEFGTIVNPFVATPTPTRAARSFALEGDAFFRNGELMPFSPPYNNPLFMASFFTGPHQPTGRDMT